MKKLFIVLVAAFALVCMAVSCQKQGSGNGVYGCSVSGESTTELRELADEMHSAVKSAVGTVSERSSANDAKALTAAQALNRKTRTTQVALVFSKSFVAAIYIFDDNNANIHEKSSNMIMLC